MRSLSLLFLKLALFFFVGDAWAAAPTTDEYACTWTKGKQRGDAMVRFTLSGSSWYGGKLTTSRPDGSSATKSVELVKPSTVNGGTTTLWNFRQLDDKIGCDLYVADGGKTLRWQACNNGVTQSCVAVTPPVKGVVAKYYQDCSGLGAYQGALCVGNNIKEQAKADMKDAAMESCTRDLLQMYRCLAAVAEIERVEPGEHQKIGCSQEDPWLKEQCDRWMNWGKGGGTGCETSMDCPGGSFCILGSGGTTCGALSP